MQKRRWCTPHLFKNVALSIGFDVNLSLQLRNIGSIVHHTGNTKEKALLKTKIVKNCTEKNENENMAHH